VAVYFDNDRDAAAPKDAVRLWEILSGRSASAAPIMEPEAPLPPARGARAFRGGDDAA
jgi:hypothetical protein